MYWSLFPLLNKKKILKNVDFLAIASLHVFFRFAWYKLVIDFFPRNSCVFLTTEMYFSQFWIFLWNIKLQLWVFHLTILTLYHVTTSELWDINSDFLRIVSLYLPVLTVFLRSVFTSCNCYILTSNCEFASILRKKKILSCAT